YLVYTDETPNESNDMDIFLRYSNDNGATWSTSTRVNDDSTVNSQFLPAVAVDPKTGYIAVTWYDARNAGSANDTAEYFGDISSDNGNSFLPNFKISAGVSNSAKASSGIDYGDFVHVDYQNGTVFTTWADNSNSTGDNPDGTLSHFDLYFDPILVNT